LGLYYEDYERLPLGHRWRSPGRTIGEADIMNFAGLTGDLHPLHTDAHFAAQSDYGARIAHGYLTASVASGLAYRIGLDESTSFAVLATGWKFKLPVRIGDTIRVEVVLTDLRPSRKHPAHGIVSRKYEVLNQQQEIIAIGEIVILVHRRPAPA
jgi:acyl dehydratase